MTLEQKECEVIKKLSVVASSLVLAGVLSVSLGLPSAHAAAKKVDCDAVMAGLSGGKKPKEVAKDLGISISSVRRCRRKAAKASGPKANPAPSPK